jgi:hypothetical protein
VHLVDPLIHWPGRSASAVRFSGRRSHLASKRPSWLAEASGPVIARSPTTPRIGGSRHSRSALFTKELAVGPFKIVRAKADTSRAQSSVVAGGVPGRVAAPLGKPPFATL